MKDNVIEMYSTHNEEKSVAAERFTKNVYIDKLDNIVDKDNNISHSAIK